MIKAKDGKSKGRAQKPKGPVPEVAKAAGGRGSASKAGPVFPAKRPPAVGLKMAIAQNEVLVPPDRPAGASRRIIVWLEAGLVDRLDAKWHERRLSSRADTIRALLEEGLK
jgi:hypothetical protein